jgi:predicted nucleic acid-binding protein
VSVPYFDTSYLVRLYFEEPGWEKVRALYTGKPWTCSLHGRAEMLAVFHRKFREGAISPAKLRHIIDQFETDCRLGEFQWLPVSDDLFEILANDFKRLPASAFLRAADALHLVCAREHGFKAIYTNDRHLLAAANHFGLQGKNIIA